MTNRPWSDKEVELIVADYFSMLEKEIGGETYVKSEHRAALIPRLNGRSDPAVEYKHCNISSVLDGLELRYVDGYKPRAHKQERLVDEVSRYLRERPDLRAKLDP